MQPYREIAEALFGTRPIERETWKTSSLRDRTIRLVRGGVDLLRGGYLIWRNFRRHIASTEPAAGYCRQRYKSWRRGLQKRLRQQLETELGSFCPPMPD